MWGALYLGKAQGVKLSEVDRPSVSGPYDVIIRMHACGICGSDLHTLDYDLRNPSYSVTSALEKSPRSAMV